MTGTADDPTGAASTSTDDGESSEIEGEGSGDGDAEDDGATFLGTPVDYGPGPTFQCDFWPENDCGDDEKCQAIFGHDASVDYDAIVCVPFGDAAVGEPCCRVAEGDCPIDGPAGMDSCDAHSICLDVDPVTLKGTCVEYCTGSVTDPVCPQTQVECTMTSNGFLNICIPE